MFIVFITCFIFTFYSNSSGLIYLIGQETFGDLDMVITPLNSKVGVIDNDPKKRARENLTVVHEDGSETEYKGQDAVIK